MKKIIWLSFMICFFTYQVFPQVEFDASKFENTKKMQRGLVTVNAEIANKFNVNKVLLGECYGAFNLSDKFLEKDFGNSSFLQKYILPEMKSYVKEIQIGDDYLALLTEFTYQRILRVLTDNGWDVVKRNNMVNHKLYQQNNFYKSESGEFNGEISADAEQTFFRSSYEMSKLPKINFNLKEPEYIGVFASIADELKCEANLRVHFSIRINNEGLLTLEKFEVKMDTWLTGYNKGKDMVYKWKVPNNDFFILDKPVTGTLNYNSANPLEINKEITKMISTIAEMFSYQLAAGI